MAELTYDNVRQATQEALSNVQSAINDLRVAVQNLQNEVARLNDVRNRMANIERNIYDLTQGMRHIHSMIRTLHTEGPVGSSQEDDATMKKRISNIEELASDIGGYLQGLHEHVSHLSEYVQQKGQG